MNNIERKIYDLVKSQPWLKDLVRNMYQGVFDLLPRKHELLGADFQQRDGYFFGFHDVSPLSLAEDKLLANKPSIEFHMPSDHDALTVGYFEFTNGKIGDYHALGQSYAWNFHKGCRLQWLNSEEFIYNTQQAGRPYAQVVNVATKETKELDYPIDSVSSDGCLASVISFERLEYLMPGYGYLNVVDGGCVEQNAPEKTGLFLFDLKTNQCSLALSLNQLLNDRCTTESESAYHYITHTEFSSDNRYVSFLHRYVSLDDLDKRVTYLVIYDRLTQKHFALPTEGMVSHYVWNGKDQIIAYCRIEGKECHTLFSISNGECVDYKLQMPDVLNSDGHQSFVTDTIFLTDTYPDKYRMAKLYLVDMVQAKSVHLVSVYSPKEFQTRDMYNHIACDLHPRVSKSGTFVCFDSSRSGKRALCVQKIR